MEFIFGLPLTVRRHDSIFVVVDTLTKNPPFIPVHMTYHALDIARICVRKIMSLHGVPKESYLIEDQCLQDDFGLVSNRPWEPNLNLVHCITLRLTGRQKERTKFWEDMLHMYVMDQHKH
jgi:hypothetical protein